MQHTNTPKSPEEFCWHAWHWQHRRLWFCCSWGSWHYPLHLQSFKRWLEITIHCQGCLRNNHSVKFTPFSLPHWHCKVSRCGWLPFSLPHWHCEVSRCGWLPSPHCFSWTSWSTAAHRWSPETGWGTLLMFDSQRFNKVFLCIGQ